jgi:LPXTG-site transpeptidase (sortase) family protein
MIVLCASVATAATFVDGGEPRAAEQAPKIAITRVVRTPEFTPSHMDIPSIGLKGAPVIPVLTRADGVMDSPKTAHEVGWYAGVKVGAGNALLAGHHDWRKQEGSFYHLEDLDVGDIVVVRGEGKTLRFRAVWIKQVNGDIDATEILADKGKPEVTLITCAGFFDRRTRHHIDRLVVRGVLA